MTNITDRERSTALDQRGLSQIIPEARGLNPESVSDYLRRSKERERGASGARFVGNMLIKKLLNSVQAYLGVAWTPVSVFMSIASSAAFSLSRLQEIKNRVNGLKAALNHYSAHASSLIHEAIKLQELTTSNVSGIADPGWYEARNLLTEAYSSLYAIGELGRRINNELRTVPEISATFRRQRTLHAVDVANLIDTAIRLDALPKFRESYRDVRVAINRLEG